MDKKAERIQTSLLNGVERKALVWLANRQPKWVSSDMLTWVGTLGAALFALGFILSHITVNWLWLSAFGLIVNWYGDSLDGTLARVRKTCAYDVTNVVHVCSAEHAMNEPNYFRGRVKAIVVPRERSIDIRSMLDFHLAELVLKGAAD